MNILFELLNELKYETKESFSFNVTINSEDINSIVTPFISVEYPCLNESAIALKNSLLTKSNLSFLTSTTI